MKINNKPLVVIFGQTASGKTGLAIKLAKVYGGEIICADSRSIYKGLDIGTAKPTQKEQSIVPHWGLDLVEPGEYFSAADFKKFTQTKIKEIRARGNIPFLVGGTGLYIDSVIFDYKFGKAANFEARNELNKLTLQELYDYCHKNNISLPENDKNKRYVIRAIERSTDQLGATRLDKPIDNAIIVGLSIDKEILRTRIATRTEQFFKDGVVDEAKRLGEKYGWDNEALTGNVYPLVHSYVLGDITWDEMTSKFSTLDWRLAKRQLTWLKRNKFINWQTPDAAEVYLTDKLAKLE